MENNKKQKEILLNNINAYEFIIFDSIDYILFDFNRFEQTAKWHQKKLKTNKTRLQG